MFSFTYPVINLAINPIIRGNSINLEYLDRFFFSRLFVRQVWMDCQVERWIETNLCDFIYSTYLIPDIQFDRDNIGVPLSRISSLLEAFWPSQSWNSYPPIYSFVVFFYRSFWKSRNDWQRYDNGEEQFFQRVCTFVYFLFSMSCE